MTQYTNGKADWIKCKTCKKGMFLHNFKKHFEEKHPELLGCLLEPMVIWRN